LNQRVFYYEPILDPKTGETFPGDEVKATITQIQGDSITLTFDDPSRPPLKINQNDPNFVR
jgi:cystathionine beta-lyase family protein involved in aluminum resistance